MAIKPSTEKRKRVLAMLSTPERQEEVMLYVVQEVSEGRTFNDVCRQNGLSRTELLMWLQADEGRWRQFQKAHEARSMHLVSETVDIADDADLDPADKKVRIDTRFRMAKYHAPELYGDKEDKSGVTVNVTVQRFADDPVTVTVEADSGAA